jgi:hypothetical protein
MAGYEDQGSGFDPFASGYELQGRGIVPRPDKMTKLENIMAEEKLIRCIVQRDRWDEKGQRIPAGTEIDVPVEEAMDGVESGALVRAKAKETK